MIVRSILKRRAIEVVVAEHYLRRRPPISFAFGLFDQDALVGVVTFGVPASRHMVVGACPSNPELVLELNRLWVDDIAPRNTETWFLAKCLSLLPPRIILSYADTSVGHVGYIYRAANFNYSGWTDMERKTPRFDYVAKGKHSRDAFRNGFTHKVRRNPKVKYWIVTGNRREKRRLEGLCKWPKFDWKKMPPPKAADRMEQLEKGFVDILSQQPKDIARKALREKMIDEVTE